MLERKHIPQLRYLITQIDRLIFEIRGGTPHDRMGDAQKYIYEHLTGARVDIYDAHAKAVDTIYRPKRD